MEAIPIVVIGAGWIGRRHVEILQQESAWRLVAIADPNPTVGGYAGELGIPWFEDHRKMLDVIQPRAAIIATPNVLHVPMGIACAERGIPMLVEKPIADNVETAMQLVEAAEQAKVPVLVGHHRRYNPIIEKAREFVLSGRIGHLTAISAQFMLLKDPDYFDMAHRRLPGAGPVTTNSAHDIDDLRFICGDIASVQAMTSNTIRGYAVEDTAVVALCFTNGALGTLTISDTAVSPWSWELTSGENPFYTRHDENCYLISGTEGALTVPRLEWWRYGEEKYWRAPLLCEQLEVNMEDPLVRQIRHFHEVVLGETEPRVSGRDAIQTLDVVQTISEAARTGHRIELKRR